MTEIPWRLCDMSSHLRVNLVDAQWNSFTLCASWQSTVWFGGQVIPKCTRCDAGVEEAIVKPDIVFFGQSLPEEFHHQMQLDKDECDLLIVIGSSLKVQPVALIPSMCYCWLPFLWMER